jgi:anti-sigma B factor antagonist
VRVNQARRTGFSSVITRHDGATVVNLAGELDIATAADLRQALTDAVSGDEPPRVVIHLEGVDFCDSTGLSVLISALNGAEAAGGRVLLSGVRARMTRLFTMTGLTKRFEIRDTADDAVQELLGG